MYNFTIPKEQLSDLWRLREFAARGPIAKQIREAISEYLKTQEKEIGCPIPDIEEAIQKHRYEQESDQPQLEIIPHVEEQDR